MGEWGDLPEPREAHEIEERRRSMMEHAFQMHARVYVLVNVFLVGVWLAVGGGYFWPIWPILGWGLAVGLQGGLLYNRR